MRYETITSRKNQLVRDAASLLSSAEKRSEAGLFIAEGARLCADAARSETEIVTCFFTENAQKKYPAYLQSVFAVCQRAYCVEEHVAQLLSDTKNSQGIFCVCKMPDSNGEKASGISVRDKKLLVLENIQDPSNMGNILRTAEALGIRLVALVGMCCDIFAPKVLRGSMGAVFRLKVKAFTDADACVDVLDSVGFTSLAAVPDADAFPITEIQFEAGRYAVWIGNEGNGLTESAIGRCAKSITIPMHGRAESFNASTAAALVMWEMMRCAKAESGCEENG